MAAAYAWLGLTGFAWSDYDLANAAPLAALVSGDWSTFLQRSPIEGPSLLLRAPFALATTLWGGGELAVYRMMAVPGLAAGMVLGVVLWAQRTRRFPDAPWPLLFVVLAAGNPVTLRALDIGHPEELLGAALCVGAVLAALGRREALAAVLLGLALANKAWAVLAIAPVLVALERHHLRVLLGAGAVAGVFVAPFLLAGEASRAAVLSAGSTDSVFQPWQAWWFLGEHGHDIRGFDGHLKVGFRAAPEWLAPVSHPLIAALVVPAGLAFWRLRGAGTGTPDALLLLAALLFARCVLDVANTGYYHLPFLVALVAWEAVRSARPPVWTLAATVAVWATFEWAPRWLEPDAQAVAYLAWAVPALVAVWVAALRPPGRPQPSAVVVPARGPAVAA